MIGRTALLRPIRIVLTAVVVLGTCTTASAQSLYRDGAPGASLFADTRARGVNDVVTILIVEQSSSSRSASTSTSKDTSRSASVSAFPTIFGTAPAKFLQDRVKIGLEGKGSHDGQGAIDRTDKVTGQITARVVKVLDNGNLLIEGRRAVLVNDDTQVITISGLVRPYDISASNTVLSSQIADAEVQMEGKGILAEAQRPGILYRFLDWLRLF
jgi:flagellar L-ring protein precursor FlgH